MLFWITAGDGEKWCIVGNPEVGRICVKSAYGNRFEDTPLIPNQSVFVLTDRTRALQNCISLIPKTKEISESGSQNCK
jgi:hypothetical protein